MKQNIKERIHALRMTFHPNSIKAFIIPSTDPHLSEYVAPHWMSREWISGFTGSAVKAVAQHRTPAARAGVAAASAVCVHLYLFHGVLLIE
jgi:hypothetical protein